MRNYIRMSDTEIVDHFKRLGFVVTIESLKFTVEGVDDFWLARERIWFHPGEIERYEEGGILIVSKAQPRQGQPTRDIAIVSLGRARVVMGVLPGAMIDERYPRYAKTMG